MKKIYAKHAKIIRWKELCTRVFALLRSLRDTECRIKILQYKSATQQKFHACTTARLI